MKLYDFLRQVCRSNDIEDYKPAVLINLAQQLPEDSRLTNDDTEALQLLQDIVTLSEDYSKSSDLFRSFISLNSSRSFAPCDMTSQKWDTLLGINLDLLPLPIKARIADFIWDQKKNHKVALNAIQSYLELFQELWDENEWPECFDMIQRAVCISAQLDKKGPEYAKCIEFIKNGIKKTHGKDPFYLSIKLLGLLQSHSKINDSVLLDVAKETVHTASQSGNIVKHEEATRLLYSILKSAGKEAEGRGYLHSLAERYVSLANNSNDIPMRRVEYMKKAYHVYSEIQEKKKAEECQRKLEVLQPLVYRCLQPFQHSIDVTEYHKHILEITDRIDNLRGFVCVLADCCAIRTRDQLFQDITCDGSLPFEILFTSKEIDEEGRQLFQLPSIDLDNVSIDSPAVHEHMWHRAASLQDIFGSTSILWIIQEMNRRIDYGKDDLTFLVKDNAIIPKGREGIIQTGIYMALKGDFYAALHILVPQFENIYRYVARMCGAITYTIEDDDSSKAKTLGSVFTLPELVDSYDEDVLFCLRGLLDERAGSNLRNRVAHGLLNQSATNRGIGIYCIALFVKILLWTAVEERTEAL